MILNSPPYTPYSPARSFYPSLLPYFSFSCIHRKSHARHARSARINISCDAARRGITRVYARFTDVVIRFVSRRLASGTWGTWRSVAYRTCGKINLIVSGIEFTWAVHLSRSSGKATKSLTTLSRYPNTASPT